MIMAMAISTSDFTKRLMWLLILVSGLSLGFTAPANAHGSSQHRSVSQHYYQPRYHRGYVNTFPRWLRKNHSFQRWYWSGDYRYDRGYGWNNLYSMYKKDRYYRKHGRHARHKRYAYSGYNDYRSYDRRSSRRHSKKHKRHH